MAGGDLRTGGSFVFVGLRGLKDFYPAYLAENVARASLPGGASVAARAVELTPPLGGDGDVNTLGFAARFEQPAFLAAVVGDLRGQLEPGERVGFPAVLGLREPARIWRDLETALERTVFEVPTLPPSVPGIRVFETLRAALRAAGGRIVIGDAAIASEAEDARVEAVVAQTAARPVAYRARSFVLASGGFASGGLELDSHGAVRETVFGLPVSGAPASGRPSFRSGYFDSQPLGRAGVAVDERLRPLAADGRPVYDNLHAAGAILAGAEPWREKAGDGISLATGYAAAAAVLEHGAVLESTR
jgi:glycerol-3-phosphate dehydrogenase subunit B